MDATTMALVGGGVLLLLVMVSGGVALSMSRQQQQEEQPRRRRREAVAADTEAPQQAGGERGPGAVYPSMGLTMSPMLTSRPVSVEWTAAPTRTPQPQPPAALPRPPAYDPWFYTDPYPQTYPRASPVAPVVAPPAGQTWFTPEEMWRYFGHRCTCPAPRQVNGGYTHLKGMTPARDQAVCCMPPETAGAAPLQQCLGFRKVPTMGWVRDANVSAIPWPPLAYTADAKCVGMTYTTRAPKRRRRKPKSRGGGGKKKTPEPIYEDQRFTRSGLGYRNRKIAPDTREPIVVQPYVSPADLARTIKL